MKKIKRKNGAIKEGFSPLTIVMAVILGMYCLILAIWLVWALLTSLKNPNDFLGNKYGLPNPWYFDNFAYVIYEYKVEKLIDGVSTVISTGDMILNSVLYSVGSAFVATLVPCITAYLCARYKYKFSKIIYSTVLVCMVIPIVGSQASELQIVIKMGIYDHMFGMWILKSGFLGLYFLVTSCKKYFLYGVADYVRDLLERLSDADALSSHTSDYIGSVILDKEQFV